MFNLKIISDGSLYSKFQKMLTDPAAIRTHFKISTNVKCLTILIQEEFYDKLRWLFVENLSGLLWFNK